MTRIYSFMNFINFLMLCSLVWFGCSNMTAGSVVEQKSRDDVNKESCEITIPNILSENGDSINNFFIIDGIENYPNSKLMILNRWGKVVYENDNYENDWKGRASSNNEPLPRGVYFYQLTLGGSKNHTCFEKVFQGSIQLL